MLTNVVANYSKANVPRPIDKSTLASSLASHNINNDNNNNDSISDNIVFVFCLRQTITETTPGLQPYIRARRGDNAITTLALIAKESPKGLLPKSGALVSLLLPTSRQN